MNLWGLERIAEPLEAARRAAEALAAIPGSADIIDLLERETDGLEEVTIDADITDILWHSDEKEKALVELTVQLRRYVPSGTDWAETWVRTEKPYMTCADAAEALAGFKDYVRLKNSN